MGAGGVITWAIEAIAMVAVERWLIRASISGPTHGFPERVLWDFERITWELTRGDGVWADPD